MPDLPIPWSRRLPAIPRRPDTLYAGTQYSGVFKTTNGGNSWTRINDDWLDKVSEDSRRSGNAVPRLHLRRPSAREFSIAFIRSLSCNGRLRFQTILSMGIDPASPKTLYAGGGAFIVNKSTDAGVTWKAANTGLPTSGMQPNSVSAIGNTLLLTDPNFGAFQSTNGGKTWVS